MSVGKWGPCDSGSRAKIHPGKVSIETVCRWLLELGFTVYEKGTYVDGNEESDVVDYRKSFLCKLSCLGFLNGNNAPTPEAAQS